MSEELTLDAFARTPSEEDSEATEKFDGSRDGEVDAEDGPVDPDEISPVSPTSIFDPDGVRCAGCSETVERLFQTSGEPRCKDCTDWEASPETDGV